MRVKEPFWSEDALFNLPVQQQPASSLPPATISNSVSWSLDLSRSWLGPSTDDHGVAWTYHGLRITELSGATPPKMSPLAIMSAMLLVGGNM
ncbi:hypothetical protein BGX21_004741, partial [Mortierella sp. AD011]